MHDNIGTIIMKKRKQLGYTQQKNRRLPACILSGGLQVGEWYSTARVTDYENGMKERRITGGCRPMNCVMRL